MQFIDEWRTVLWRSASVWVGGIVGGIVGIVTAHWLLLLGILPFMPLWVQLPVSLIVGVVVIGGPQAVARIWPQPKMQEKIAEKSDGVA